MPKRLMTEDEYAAWQQNAKAGVYGNPVDAAARKRLEGYLKRLESLPDASQRHPRGKQRRAKRQNGN